MMRLFAIVALFAPVACAAQTDQGIGETPTRAAPSGATPVRVRQGFSVGPAFQPVAEAEIKPRLELLVPSVRTLITDIRRSHSGIFLAPLGRLAAELAGASAEGVEAGEAAAIFKHIQRWPDTAISAYTFAPDTEGRLRWAIQFDWPLNDLRDRAGTLLELRTTAELFEGVALHSTADKGARITLGESTLAYLVAIDESRSCVTSHMNLPLPTKAFAHLLETTTEAPSLMVCRLNLAGTEKDSGATFLSSFSAVTDVVYSGRVDDDGNWIETVLVHWPPISGMGAKALFGKVKQTFFVPGEAFGALAVKAIMGPGMLDAMAGFGQQMVMEAPGQMTIVGEAGIGPIAASVESQMCVTLLPGTGFLPMPDIVVQARTRTPEQLIDRLRDAAEHVNEECRLRDWKEPWHESIVRERTVFWSDSAAQPSGVIMPLLLRPVLFTTAEIDARGRERDFLVLGWTSTSPEGFVRRWLDLPRSGNKQYVPKERKTNGQLWVNWKQVYKWVSPYVNVPLGAVVGAAPLPGPREATPHMTDALVTVKTSYTGLNVSHNGPLPAGALVVPTLVKMSTSTDRSGGSDLARERLACQRLKVLYHHATLFKKDVGRWPAEVVELRGYVDFEGHPELLRLELSSRKKWTELFQGFVGLGKPDDDEEKGEEDLELDNDLFLIDWGRDSWRLKLAPNTLEHLEELYIDQSGIIHRREKVESGDRDGLAESGKSSDGSAAGSVFHRAVRNMKDRSSAPGEESDAKKE